MPLKQLVVNGSQTTVHAGYVKHIFEMLDSFKLPVWGLTIDAWWSAGVFLSGFLVEVISMSGRLVFLNCYIFIFIFLIFKFLFKQFIFPH